VNFTCRGCGITYPEILKNIHHVDPIEYGGKDVPENRHTLCVGCHQVLHYLSWRQVGNKGDAERLVKEYLVSLECREIAKHANVLLDYVNIVARHIILFRQGVEQTDERKSKKVKLELSHGIKELTRMSAKHSGLGLERYIQVLILTHLKQQYPYAEDAINEELLTVVGHE
jgi:hypothetical protein